MKAEPAKAHRNPVRGVKLLKENNTRVRVLADAEEDRLMKALPEYLKPFLVLALHTGMRWGELARLEWKDVDFDVRTLTVTEAKSGEGRRIPMNQVVSNTLQHFRRTRRAFSGLIFQAPEGGFLHNFRRTWARAVKDAGITNFRFHDLRHTAASRLVMAGTDLLYTVKEILGHRRSR